jgi:hypothetical protein
VRGETRTRRSRPPRCVTPPSPRRDGGPCVRRRPFLRRFVSFAHALRHLPAAVSTNARTPRASSRIPSPGHVHDSTSSPRSTVASQHSVNSQRSRRVRHALHETPQDLENSRPVDTFSTSSLRFIVGHSFSRAPRSQKTKHAQLLSSSSVLETHRFVLVRLGSSWFVWVPLGSFRFVSVLLRLADSRGRVVSLLSACLCLVFTGHASLRHTASIAPRLLSGAFERLRERFSSLTKTRLSDAKGFPAGLSRLSTRLSGTRRRVAKNDCVERLVRSSSWIVFVSRAALLKSARRSFFSLRYPLGSSPMMAAAFSVAGGCLARAP